MRTVIVCLLVVCGLSVAQAQTCLAGENGPDGANLTVTIVTDLVTGCYKETFSDNPLHTTTLCNGTNAGTCPMPVVTTVGQAPGCAAITGNGAVLFCNASAITGDTGATGATGAAGATGSQVNFTSVNQPAGCALVIGTGSAQLCNGTSNVAGATGLTGLTGAAGTNGTAGATGATGSAGITGLLPTYVIVDGTTYARTVGGINAALAATPVGGTTYITGSTCAAPLACTTTPVVIPLDCNAAITIPTGVTLDLGGNTLQMPSNSTVCNPFVKIDGRGGTNLLPSQALAQNAAEGSLTVVITPTIAVTSAFLTAANTPGSNLVCTLSNGFYGAINSAHAQDSLIVSADNTTGIITLREPLAASFTSATGTIACTTWLSADAGIRNGILDAAANSGSGGYALLTAMALRATVVGITFTGSPSGSPGFAPLWVFHSIDSRYERLLFDSIGGYSVAGIRSQNAIGSFFTDIEIRNPNAIAGYGMYLTDSDYSVYSDITFFSSNQLRNAFQLSISSHNVIDNLVVGGAAQGLTFTSVSHHNVVNGVVVQAALFGVVFSVAGDSYNQVLGISCQAPGTSGCVFPQTGAIGNYYDGELLPASGSLLQSAAGGTLEPTLFNSARQTVNVNGHASLAVHNQTVLVSDFVAAPSLAISVVNDGTVAFNVLKVANGVTVIGKSFVTVA